MDYSSLSVEAIQQLISELTEALQVKQGRMTRRTLYQKLDPSSQDFMGSGMSFEEFWLAGEIERINRSYVRQDRIEQKRRLDLVIRLSTELQVVEQKTNFSGAFAKDAIANTFEGDWEGLQINIDALRFTGEHASTVGLYQPLYAKFVTIMEEAIQHAPKQESESAERIKH